MYPVSQDFHEKMKAQSRRIYGKIQVDYTDPSIDQSIQVSANENANYSYPEQVSDNIEEPHGKIASLDGSWVLDGTYVLAPAEDEADEYQMGWWGSQLSDSSGNYTAPYPTLVVTFAPRPIHRLQVIADNKRKEWPVNFTINLYSNDTLMHTETVTGNTEIFWSTDIERVNEITKMELIITKWSHANRQVKILEFFTSIQETYEGDDILLIHLLEEREVSQGSLPVGNISSNEIDIRLVNKNRKFDAGNRQSPLYQLLKANRRIKAWLGTYIDYDIVPTEFLVDTDAEWNQGTLTDVVVVNGGLELERVTRVIDDFNIDTSSQYIKNNLDVIWDTANSQLQIGDTTASQTGFVYKNEKYGVGKYEVKFKMNSGSDDIHIYFAVDNIVYEDSPHPGNGYGIVFYPEDNKIEFRPEYFTGDEDTAISYSLSLNTWYTVTWTWEDGSMRFWINNPEMSGSPDHEYSYASNQYVSEGYLTFGVSNSCDVIDYFRAPIYKPTGTRTQQYNLSPISTANDSVIEWEETLNGQTATIETNLSLDNGQTWLGWKECTNGGSIPDITAGLDLSNAILDTRQTLSTNDTTVTPRLEHLKITINGIEHFPEPELKYIPLGTFWSGDWTAPEGEIYVQTTGRDRLELLSQSTFSSSPVYQNKTLYNLAKIVLEDAGIKEEEYWIDTELQEFLIPYAYFEPVSHREALRKIAEASLGQCYCDRDGLIRLEGYSYLQSKTEPDIVITRDDYFMKDNPHNYMQIANYIEVETQPLRPAPVEEVYRSNEPVSISAGETISITAYYNVEPCIEAVASIEGTGTISDVTYYSWGADVKVTSSVAGEFELVINAKPLKVQGAEKVVAKDDDSIRENGRIKYTFPKNPLVQTRQQAQKIADNLLAYYKEPRRDLSLEWRGNPALLLGDRIQVVDEYGGEDFFVTKQNIEYDGGLRVSIEGRKADGVE